MPLNGWAGKTSSIASSTRGAAVFFITTGPTQKPMQTSKRPTSPDGGEQLTCFPVASPVNPTPRLGSDLAKKMTGISGLRCLEQFERLPRAGSWGRTFAGLLIGMGDWSSTKCNLTWRLRATKSSRFYFQLAASERRTNATEFGLLPTPTASDWRGGCDRTGKNARFQTCTLRHWAHAQTSLRGKTSHPNPRFVAEMMGFPVNWTELPFQVGGTKA